MHENEISFILNELGEERSNYFNAVSPPIMQTSNFAFKTVDELRHAFEDEYEAMLYSRGNNPTVNILRQKLAALDGAEDCLVFNSGAAAVFAPVFANVKSGDHIVSVRNPYSWTQKFFNVILPRLNVTTTYIDGTDIENFKSATKENTVLYFLESPNSWTFEMQDLQAVSSLAKEKNIITIIDNSYCSPLYQKPIELGIDISMQTATKYIGGHSDTVAGVITGTKSMMKKIFNSEYMTVGSGIQPFNAWLLIRGLRTLPARLERISATTKKLVAFVKAHPLVEEIIFPFDESFPQYELARKQMKDALGLFTFIIKTDSIEKIETFCNNLQHILMAVSWGGHESLIIPRCAGIQRESFDASNKEHRMIRMYCGLEDADYLINDLKQALDSI